MPARCHLAVASLLTTVTAASAVAAVVACGSSGGDGSSTLVSDAAARSPSSDPPGDGGNGDATMIGDAGALDAETDSGSSSIYGDRNLGVSEPFPDSVLIQNGGRFYNLQKPPTSMQTAAKGDGKTDDTAAWLDAFDFLRAAYVSSNPTGADVSDYDAENYYLYAPDGTYLVSSTLSYRKALSGNDIVRVRIVGESRERTIIRLADATPAFADADAGATVLEFQHDGTTFNNEGSDNLLANLTIDTGSGNPGANALWFQGANATSMHNVLLESEDGKGHCGLDFPTGSLQGYFRDITVLGFDYGICQLGNPEFDSALEHVTLERQNKAGLYLTGGGMSARLFAVDESATGAEGLRVEQSGAVVFVDDSSFTGAAGTPAALDLSAATEQALFARDIVTSGFATSLLRGGIDAKLGASIAFYDSSAPFTLLDAGAKAAPTSLRLPVEDTPLASWHDPATEWADVDTFGAKGDGTTDDTAALQKALDSGMPVVVFPRGKYKTSGSLHVPATVERVDFMFSDMTADLVVDAPSAVPLRLSHHISYASCNLTAARPVVLDHWSGGFNNGNPATTPTTVYIENADNIGAGPSFVAAGSTVWARSLNDEQGAGGNPDIFVNGGTLWLFGYKTENKAVTSISVNQGGTVEVLNGYVNMTSAPGTTPMLVSNDSTIAFFGFTNLGAAIHGPFTDIIHETRDGGATATLTYDAGFGGELPRRGGTYAADFVIPLYRGAP